MPTQTVFTEQDYDRFLECVHCGLCLPSCPTYSELGHEADSPRGRVYLMKGIADGRMKVSPTVTSHLDRCLGCLACETACPSGVHYGQLIERARIIVEEQYPRPLKDRLLRWFMTGLLPYPNRLELSLLPIRLLRALGLRPVMESAFFKKLMPEKIRPMLELVPELPALGARNAMREVFPPVGKRQYRVALLTGCVMSVMFDPVNRATARVLAKNGCEVIVPRGQVCCGALHLHMGDEEEALNLVRQNVSVFSPGEVDAIIVNAAGCGAAMKEYGKLLAREPHLAEKAKAFAAKTRDISEFLAEIDLNTEFRPVNARAAYHDACHLAHAQNIRAQPRALLEQIPGLVLIPLRESDTCCGSAGPYNLVEPEMAGRLLERKIHHIADTGCNMLINGNPGCSIQIANGIKAAGLDIEVLHTIQVLDRAYGS